MEHRNTTNNQISGSTLRGYAVLWDARSRLIRENGREFTETISKGAFSDSLKDNEDDVKLYFNHQTDMPLARTRNGSLRLREDDKGLSFEADLPDTTLANDIKELLDRGTLSGEMSFGFYSEKESWSNDRKERTIQKARLMEVSVVTDAAYPSTYSSLRSANLKEINQKRINLLRRKTKS